MKRITIDKASNGFIVTIGHGYRTLVYETQDAFIQALSEHVSQDTLDALNASVEQVPNIAPIWGTIPSPFPKDAPSPSTASTIGNW